MELTELDKEIYNWKDFVNYANENGISLEHEEDWKSWWGCWVYAQDTSNMRN